MGKTAITPTRAEDYPNWYQEVIKQADLAENSVVRGCMVIKPWGYALWEHIQQDLDARFKATGHVNAYFPLLIPLSHLEKEAQHVAGFAKECAVVTHHRLIEDGKGGLKPDGELEEPLVIRPTSETIIGGCYANWIDSYRDLPLKINQWANVMRWEMRTRLFLRTSEFLWQEGHTAHATAEEARQETLDMLNVYEDFSESFLAMPVIKGEKTEAERFPGAVNTYCIEAMMQDRKALQAGTSHFLGQNFAKASGIQFDNSAGERVYAWTTSWGVSTRLIGGMIMTHSDDNGLVLPPKVATQQIVILPIYRTDEDRTKVLEFCHAFQADLRTHAFAGQPIRVAIDDRDMNGGEKTWQWIKKGVPIRVEVGPRDLAAGSVFVGQRNHEPRDKKSYKAEEFLTGVSKILQSIQESLFAKAKAYQQEASVELTSLKEFNEFFTSGPGGFVTCYACDVKAMEEATKPLKVSARCIPLEQNHPPGQCIFTGEKTKQKIIFAKAY